MNRVILLIVLIFSCSCAFAQPNMIIDLKDGLRQTMPLSVVHSLSFKTMGSSTLVNIYQSGPSRTVYPVAVVDSMIYAYKNSDSAALMVYMYGVSRSFKLSKIDSVAFTSLETKFSPNVRWLDSLNRAVVVRIDSTHVVLNSRKANISKLPHVGDFIVNGVDPSTPFGFMKRVVTIRPGSDSIVIDVENASITDVIQQGVITVRKQLSPSDTISQAKQQNNIQSNGFSIGIKDLVMYDDDNNNNTKNDQILFNGALTIDPRVSVNIVIENFKLLQLLVQLSVQQSLSLDVMTTVLNVSKDVKKSIIPSPYWFTPIPTSIPFVFITPNIDVEAGCSFSLKAGISTGCSEQTSTISGIEYNNGIWRPLSDFTYSFNYQRPKFTAEGSVKGFVGPELNINININGIKGALNAYANTRAFLELTADPFSTPWWELSEGIEANAGIESTWLNKSYELPLLLDFRKKLASADYKIVSISPKSAHVGDVVVITGSGFGDTRGSGWVQFNGIVAVDYVSWADGQIMVRVPNSASTGLVNVTIFGTIRSNGINLTILPPGPPKITMINPTSARIGDLVTITGTGFGSSQGTSKVYFNSGALSASEYQNWNDSLILVKVPNGTMSSGVKVVLGGGSQSNSFNFTVDTSSRVITLIADKDAYVEGVKGAANYNGVNLKIGYQDNPVNQFYAALYFSLPPGIKASDVKDARIYLTKESGSGLQKEIDLVYINSDWNESNINGNWALVNIGTTSFSMAGAVSNDLVFTVTDAVTKWLADPASNHGVVIYPSALMPRAVFTYYDRENGSGDQRPRLTITLK